MRAANQNPWTAGVRRICVMAVVLVAALCLASAVAAQSSDELDELRKEIEKLREAIEEVKAEAEASKIEELERKIEALAEELERVSLGSTMPEADQGLYGLGNAASKVYRVEQGLSIGGYGELLYESFSSEREDGERAGRDDQADALRAVLYFGYKFTDNWIFNSEIEVEHGSTSEEGSVSLEFAYIDYLWRPELNVRAGMVLAPLGFLNELHEPPLFLGTERPNTEKAIIPSTWRENGVGIFGDIGPFTYRTYLMNGLRGERFSSAGVRGGRQKGSEALANDIGWAGRFDYTGRPGLIVGASAYVGDSGQGLTDAAGQAIDLSTEIFDLHVDWKYRGFQLRGLYAQADLGDVARLNSALELSPSNGVAESLEGYYLEIGYDVLNRLAGEAQLIPFVRSESLDTQESVPVGNTPNLSRRSDILTYGLSYKPLDELVFKIDFQDWSNDAETGVDQWNLAVGYLF